MRKWMGAVIAAGCIAAAGPAATANSLTFSCDAEHWLCADSTLSYDAGYSGADEPGIFFYSKAPGSGNSLHTTIIIPTEPPVRPNQQGTGGTFTFQLTGAFWIGMVMCDTESYPNYSDSCTPNSDANIHVSHDVHSPKFLGKHPGAAYMEFQFYAPGWVFGSPTQWSAALNIFELSLSARTGQFNNAACLQQYGREPAMHARVTANGSPQGPVLWMNPGDVVRVEMHDTAGGFEVVLHDLTLRASGSATASVANGFYQVLYRPNEPQCRTRPYAYHPMYASSQPGTILTWSNGEESNAHLAVELGHFEYCSTVSSAGTCTAPGAGETALDADDARCYPAAQSHNVMVSGCTAQDLDFDGPPYHPNWPGSLVNAAQDQRLHPSPIRFTSPQFENAADGGRLTNFPRVGFGTDIPTLEGDCIYTGIGCSNPPPGATFYPIFSIGQETGRCMWRFGGAFIPGTTDSFGGSAAAQYGSLAKTYRPYPNPRWGEVYYQYLRYRRRLSANPCPVTGRQPTPTAGEVVLGVLP